MPEESTSWLAKYRVEDYENYEPVLDRLSTERRVLGFITDEDHAGRGPRNTAERLTLELALDEFTDVGHEDEEAVQKHLDDLEAEGLVEQVDGTYRLTAAGFVELAN